MHLTATVAQFRPVFARVAKAAPARSPKPVLANVLLTAPQDGPATLSGTDLELGLSHDLPGATVLAPGRCLLPPRIGAALASLPADAILDISVVGDRIHLSAPGWSSKLASEDPDLFPVVPGSDSGTPFATVAGGDLKVAINRTTYSCDELSTRFALGGCLAEIDGDARRLVLVGTDGRRLVKVSVPSDLPPDREGDDGKPAKPVLSRRFLDMVAGLIDPDATLELRLDGSRAAIAVQAGWSLYGRLVEGRFPAYESVFPDAASAVVRATVDTAELLAAVQRVAAIACSDESRGLDLLWTAGGLELSSESADRGRSDGLVAVTYEGVTDGMKAVPDGGVVVTMDHRYLGEMLGRSAPASVRFDTIDHKNAVVVRGDGDDLMACLMPLTRDR